MKSMLKVVRSGEGHVKCGVFPFEVGVLYEETSYENPCIKRVKYGGPGLLSMSVDT